MSHLVHYQPAVVSNILVLDIPVLVFRAGVRVSGSWRWRWRGRSRCRCGDGRFKRGVRLFNCGESEAKAALAPNLLLLGFAALAELVVPFPQLREAAQGLRRGGRDFLQSLFKVPPCQGARVRHVRGGGGVSLRR